MSLIWDLWEIPPDAKDGAVSVGNFDGVHSGHRELILQLRKAADRHRGPAVVVTFDPHPAAILRPGSEPERLTEIPRRSELLCQLGVDHVVVAQTSPELLSLSAESFFNSVLVRSLRAKAIIEGPNFFFGRDRGGTPELLCQWSKEAGIDCEIIQPRCLSESMSQTGQMVSSSILRKRIKDGDIDSANSILTAPYRLSGRVVHGDGRGHKLGFPTANLAEISTLIPAHGVYATVAWVDGKPLPSATHIGPNPTFESKTDSKVEVHIIDFSRDLYETKLEIDFLGRLRSIVRFNTIDALITQLQQDIQAAKRIISYAGDSITRTPPRA